jgi:hypothetical protein
MSQVICSSCFEVEDTTKRFIELPYVCALCEKDSALAIEQDVWEAEYVGPACQQAAEEVHGLYIEAEDNIPCDAPYNSGVPCQSALDSVQEEQFDMDANSDINQFDADTELINGLMVENDDLKMKLSQANLNIQIQGEIIADLENTVGAYRVIFRIPGC